MADSRFSFLSPLVQDGLEIPIWVAVTMDLGESKVQVMKKYENVVNEYYREPVNRTFDDMTTSVLEALMSDDEDDDESDAESGAEGPREWLCFRRAWLIIIA